MRVGVSQRGDRTLRVMSEVFALQDDISEKIVGSVTWKKKMRSPKYRLERTRVDVPWTGSSRSAKFDVLQEKRNDLTFRLVFDQPLMAGQYFKYRFYIWSREHYAMSRRTALRLSHDQWIREGVTIRDPTETLTIIVDLPDGYRCQGARVERDPNFAEDGTNTPGSVVSPSKSSDFWSGEGILRLVMNYPGAGSYFVCWIPPE
jgi:hypothetical protein